MEQVGLLLAGAGLTLAVQGITRRVERRGALVAEQNIEALKMIAGVKTFMYQFIPEGVHHLNHLETSDTVRAAMVPVELVATLHPSEKVREDVEDLWFLLNDFDLAVLSTPNHPVVLDSAQHKEQVEAMDDVRNSVLECCDHLVDFIHKEMKVMKKSSTKNHDAS